MNVKLLSLGSVHQCRWVASQLRVLKALDQNYQAICKHFQSLIQDVSKDAAKVSGLLTKLHSPKFVSFLLFKDFIQVITRLSEMFQRDDLLVIEVIPQLEATVLQLVEMQRNPGISIASLAKGNLYEGVDVSVEVGPDLSNLHNEFITAAVDYNKMIDFKPYRGLHWRILGF